MLKLFATFIAAMTLFASIYLLFTNATQTSLLQFKKKDVISVNLPNIPEIILPSKEENAGYQYELLMKYLDSLDKQKVKFDDTMFDLKIFYAEDICKRCVIINNQDLLLVSNDYDSKENDIEINVFFNKDNYDLIGWQNTDVYQNFNITFLSSIRKNRVISKNIFKLPTPN